MTSHTAAEAVLPELKQADGCILLVPGDDARLHGIVKNWWEGLRPGKSQREHSRSPQELVFLPLVEFFMADDWKVVPALMTSLGNASQDFVHSLVNVRDPYTSFKPIYNLRP